ncbi:MAG: pyridoxamine 5'-phosphate oxidase family protein [Desulfosarcinaceae bacterium]
MNLKNYFEDRKGLGVLSTADSNGNVNAAVYSRPHFLEEGSLTFIMRDRLTRHNLASNPNAVFLFVENGDGYKGKRLYLKKLKEELDPELVRKIKRRKYDDGEPKYLAYFSLEKALPLIGADQD